MGVRIRLPHTDADAFGRIVSAEAGEPLSPSSLGRRIGITSGAITALLRRLENRDLIDRLRDSSDGRRVALRPTRQGRNQLLAFVEANGAEIDEILHRQSAETIDTVACFVLELTKRYGPIICATATVEIMTFRTGSRSRAPGSSQQGASTRRDC